MMVLPREIKAEAPTAKVRRNKNDKLWIVPEVLPPGFFAPQKSRKSGVIFGCWVRIPYLCHPKARTSGRVYGAARGFFN